MQHHTPTELGSADLTSRGDNLSGLAVLVTLAEIRHIDVLGQFTGGLSLGFTVQLGNLDSLGLQAFVDTEVLAVGCDSGDASVLSLENVNLVLGDHTATLPQARKYLQMLDLADAAEKYPAELSGGMQQRVAIARALATNADLLIFDEPFKAMDEALRNQVIDLVDKTDAAILMVTHERSEAEHLHCRIFQIYP